MKYFIMFGCFGSNVVVSIFRRNLVRCALVVKVCKYFFIMNVCLFVLFVINYILEFCELLICCLYWKCLLNLNIASFEIFVWRINSVDVNIFVFVNEFICDSDDLNLCLFFDFYDDDRLFIFLFFDFFFCESNELNNSSSFRGGFSIFFLNIWNIGLFVFLLCLLFLKLKFKFMFCVFVCCCLILMFFDVGVYRVASSFSFANGLKFVFFFCGVCGLLFLFFCVNVLMMCVGFVFLLFVLILCVFVGDVFVGFNGSSSIDNGDVCVFLFVLCVFLCVIDLFGVFVLIVLCLCVCVCGVCIVMCCDVRWCSLKCVDLKCFDCDFLMWFLCVCGLCVMWEKKKCKKFKFMSELCVSVCEFIDDKDMDVYWSFYM